MIPDLPIDASCLSCVVPEAMGVAQRLQAAQTANAGYVVWDACTPANELWRHHRVTMLDAFYTGLAFCGTHTQHEWCILGPTVFMLLRSLLEFQQVEAVDCYPLLFVGKVKTISVYIPASGAITLREPMAGDRSLRIESDGFFIGVEDRCALGRIQNHQITGCTAFLVW